jgi:hypothetical protein
VYMSLPDRVNASTGKAFRYHGAAPTEGGR